MKSSFILAVQEILRADLTLSVPDATFLLQVYETVEMVLAFLERRRHCDELIEEIQGLCPEYVPSIPTVLVLTPHLLQALLDDLEFELTRMRSRKKSDLLEYHLLEKSHQLLRSWQSEMKVSLNNQILSSAQSVCALVGSREMEVEGRLFIADTQAIARR